ncbi:MAG: hypothetical protein HZA58_00025 [Acidimicrobiia bacterium]|nr:hypothetical protein [Acidimicrobiia bacterium]
MSADGGYGDVEGDDVARRLSEHDIEAILSGGVPADPSLDALASLIRSADFSEAVPGSIAASHITAATAAAAAHLGRQAAAAPIGRPRRRLLVRGALSGITAKVILGTAVALAATGGAAATGILPGPVQSLIADGAAHLGLDLPHREHPTTTTSTTAVATTLVPAATTTTTVAPSPDAWDELAGPHVWSSTACNGAAVAVAYEVTTDGDLILGVISGGTAVVETAPDRIEIRFADGVRIRIVVRIDGDGPGIDEDEDRNCDEGDNEGDDESPAPDDDLGDGDDDETEPPGSGTSNPDASDDEPSDGDESPDDPEAFGGDDATDDEEDGLD